MPAGVHDAYVNGRAVLTARLFGLIKVMESPDSPELTGELLRFLAEGPWYPTALLPGPHVSWEPIDDDSARLTLVAEAQFHWTSAGADGLIRLSIQMAGTGMSTAAQDQDTLGT